MGRPCTVCSSPMARDVDADLLAGIAVHRVAKRFALPKTSVARHKTRHLKRAVDAAVAERAKNNAGAAIDQVKALHLEALENLRLARSSGSLDAANGAVGAATRAVELAAKITGELPTAGGTTINNMFGVRVDVAQRAVETVREASSADPRDVVERARRVLCAWNATHPEERVTVT